MKSKPGSGGLKKILFYAIMFLMVGVVIEICARAYYYQRLSSHRIATVQVFRDIGGIFSGNKSGDEAQKRIRKSAYLVRPELSHAENDSICLETAEANRAAYQSWVHFGFRNYEGRYVNIRDHIRQSKPEISGSSKGNMVTILFLGGSTMYGFHVTDAETIPSSFVNAYRQRFPDSPAIQVINLGIPYYFSYQELILLCDRIFKGQKPDVVVMLDGLNECLQASAAFLREPVFAPMMRQTINEPEAESAVKQMNYYQLPVNIPIDSSCSIIARHYFENIASARKIADAYGIRLYCFWQPIPFYDYPGLQHDPIAAKFSTDERFQKIYPRVKEKSGELNYLFFLGDMLENVKGLPFVDQVHYSPQFNKVIAEKMLDIMERRHFR